MPGPRRFPSSASKRANLHYDIDAGSQDPAVGMLTQGIEARGSLVRLETGREISLSGGLDVAPRLWPKRSALSMDDFFRCRGIPRIGLRHGTDHGRCRDDGPGGDWNAGPSGLLRSCACA